MVTGLVPWRSGERRGRRGASGDTLPLQKGQIPLRADALVQRGRWQAAVLRPPPVPASCGRFRAAGTPAPCPSRTAPAASTPPRHPASACAPRLPNQQRPSKRSRKHLNSRGDTGAFSGGADRAASPRFLDGQASLPATTSTFSTGRIQGKDRSPPARSPDSPSATWTPQSRLVGRC